MARRTNLRQFQENVAARLRDVSARGAFASGLGFQVAGEHCFVDLAEVTEVIPMPAVMPVPLSQPWFLGVANVRGNLVSIIDFAQFLGRPAIAPSIERRVILINDRLVAGAGLVISRMVGLRNPGEFTALPRDEAAPAWEKGAFRDPAGVRWRQIDLAALAHDAKFLDAGR